MTVKWKYDWLFSQKSHFLCPGRRLFFWWLPLSGAAFHLLLLFIVANRRAQAVKVVPPAGGLHLDSARIDLLSPWQEEDKSFRLPKIQSPAGRGTAWYPD
jgi:hypothetical protein